MVGNNQRKNTKNKKQKQPKNKRTTKEELFLDLAAPNKSGNSRPVSVDEFVGKYAELKLGNGGSWCRTTSALGKKYNVARHKKGNRIDSVQLLGFNEKPIDKSIPPEIKDKISKERCAVLATGQQIECDHKIGDLENPKYQDSNNFGIDDYQPLSKPANDAKRQHCKNCMRTKKRFDAKNLGYKVGYVKGGKEYKDTCEGCYWYDPKFFNKEISKNYK